jgi:DNA-binding ferritin-like protein
MTQKKISKNKNGRSIKYQKYNGPRKTRKTYGSRMEKKMEQSSQPKGINNQKKSHLVKIFLEMLNVIKLYHWKTRSFSQHKATDELYSRLNENIDKFVEVLLGKDQSRINMVEKNIELLDTSSTKEFQTRVLQYRGFLTDLDRYFYKKGDTDILNIRDEILGDINQFLYLLTFDK